MLWNLEQSGCEAQLGLLCLILRAGGWVVSHSVSLSIGWGQCRPSAGTTVRLRQLVYVAGGILLPEPTLDA